jgi:mono/diheme cytochrome c family protein
MNRRSRALSLARRSVALAAAGIALAACGEGGEPAAPPAPQSTAPEPAPPAAQPLPAPQPTPAPQIEAADAARGATLYATYCATCHGPRGDGDGPGAAALDPKPAKHSDSAYMDALSDDHLLRVIQQGGPAVGRSPLMPAWGGSLSDAQIRDLVAFVRSLSRS